MEAIKITVTGADARAQQKPLLTCGMVGVPVEFTFDESWEDLKKTAVFRVGMVTLDVVNVGNACAVPHELLLTPYRTLRVGVYGTNPDGSLVIPTVWAEAGQILPGVDPSGDASTDPTLPVWQQLRQQLDNYYTKDESDQMAQELVAELDIPTKAYVYEEAVRAAEIVAEKEIGDISIALDQLHAYAEALKGGESV